MRGRQIVLPEYRLAFFTVPKCASGSVCATFQAALRKKWGQIPLHQEREPVLWDGWEDCDRAAIVRHPYDRFMSAFRFQKRGDLENWIETVCNTPDGEGDVHYISQSRFLTFMDVLVPNRVMRFETLHEEWPGFADMANARLPPIYQLPRLLHRNKSAGSKALTADMKAMLAERYAEDFERFGYGK